MYNMAMIPRGTKQRSPEASKYRAWHKTARWQRRRARQLAKHPLCQCPHCREGKGRFSKATVVDHIIPHRGDPKLFWDENNLQSMAADCHDRWKQSQESGGHGFMSGCDERGWPLSQDHPFHAPVCQGRRG